MSSASAGKYQSFPPVSLSRREGGREIEREKREKERKRERKREREKDRLGHSDKWRDEKWLQISLPTDQKLLDKQKVFFLPLSLPARFG